jgi:hypothetical protein
MLVALAISHLLMPAALTLQDYHYLCLWLVRNINKKSYQFDFQFKALNTGLKLKNWTRVKRLAKVKCSSLLVQRVSGEVKV